MRKIFTTLKSVVAVALIAAMTLAASCSYDDSAIKERVSNVEKDLKALTDRVAALEKKLQTEVDSLKALIDGQVVVVDVITDAEGNQTIKLSDGKEITVLAPTQCTHECTPCDCDTLQYRVINGVLEVSADGENWVAVNGVSADCVVASIVLNEDGTATITLANGESFTVVKAELIECEAARTGVFVPAGGVRDVAFAVNDAVVDINVMNQPFGWSATVEEATAPETGDGGAAVMPLAAGGKNYVLKIYGPDATFAQAAKEGVVSVHFNTAAGACKVLKVNVELAKLTIAVDNSGNITLTNSVAKTAGYDELGNPMFDFVDFHIGIVAAEDYATYGDRVFAETFDDWTYEYTANIASTMRTTGFQNVVDLQWYEDGVCEEEVYTLTVDQLAGAFWPKYTFELGKEYIIFVTTESEMVSYAEQPILTNAAKASYKRVNVQANLLEETITWNDATCEFNFAGFNYYVVGWTPVSDLQDIINNGMATDLDSALSAMISAYGVLSAGAIVGDMNATVKLSELATVSLTQWAPMLNSDTEYVFFVYPFNAATEMELYMHTFVPENLYNYGTFRTKALVQGDFDAAAEFELVNLDENNVEVNATFAEEVVTVAYNWSVTSYLDPEEGAAFILGDLYYTEYVTFNEYITSLTASNYKYYGIPESYYLCVLAINAAGEYVYIEYNVRSEQGGDEPVVPEDLIYTTGKMINSYWSDVYVQLYGNDNTTIQLNGMNTCSNSQHYFTPGTYQVGTMNGHFYEGETCLIDNATGAQRGFYGGSIVISVVDEMYRIELDVTDAYGESFVAVFQGVIEGMDLPGEQGGDEPEQPEQPEEPKNPSELVYNYAYTYGDWDDCTIYVISEDESYAIVMNFYGIIPYDKGYIPEGTYDFGSFYGAVYTGGYSYLYDFATQSASWIYAGTVAVSEVDGKYRLVINAQYGDTMKELSATFEGAIDGLLLPSQYVEPEPEPEPEVTSFPAVRADYDFQMELYEYNSGDAEYAFWLYDANNNYIEVVSKFGPHTNWDTVNSSKIVIDGVESQATSLQTQKPNTWNCGAGELYFVVIATYADGTHVEIAAQLPATERNFLGEGSTYAPGSEYTGGDEGGSDEPEQPAEVVELNPTDWFKSYSGGNELELGWFDQDGYSIMIDFLMNPITPGTYTLTNGLSGMYTKYRGIGMTSCTVVVTDAGDGQLAFDVNFKAQIEGVFTDYHFTWVGDPSTL